MAEASYEFVEEALQTPVAKDIKALSQFAYQNDMVCVYCIRVPVMYIEICAV